MLWVEGGPCYGRAGAVCVGGVGRRWTMFWEGRCCLCWQCGYKADDVFEGWVLFVMAVWVEGGRICGPDRLRAGGVDSRWASLSRVR